MKLRFSHGATARRSPASQSCESRNTPHPATDNQGVALVVVLAFLVLITVLVIAFFSSVSTELSGAKSYANESAAKQLGDSAVQAVMSAISTATSGSFGQAWSSQPGLVRVYDNTGNLINNYKLYSSDTPVTSGSVNDIDTQWTTKPALFTDLNSPLVSGTSVVFPIVDGNAIKSGTVNGATVFSYFTSGTASIAGFSTDPSQAGITYSQSATPTGTNNPVPMPVKWLYVLNNGAIIAPDSTSGKTATFTNASTKPTSANPIVGRIAYWTDDETCKVNVNTASEGTYWDVPHASVTQEYNLAKNQPALHEFQTYPGHPATTSLSAVFPNLTSDQIYSLVPRVEKGGSLGGTAVATASVPIDHDRLYTSIDEVMFQPILSATTSGSARPWNDPGSTPQSINQTTLGQARFFLTASSRAPETNPFNMPKVACWPICTLSDTNHRTAYDRLIAFCSTMGSSSNPLNYYFQRSNSYSTTDDYLNIARNQSLYSYLQSTMTQPVPGFGGTLRQKFGAAESDQILTEIFDYIRCTNLFDDNLPGNSVGGTTPHITFNQFTDPRRSLTSGTQPPWAGHGQAAPIVITTSSGTTQGFGRYNTISEVGLGIICTADGNGPGPNIPGAANDARSVSNLAAAAQLMDSTGNMVGSNYTSGTTFPANATLTSGTLTPGQRELQAILLMKLSCPSFGYEGIYPHFQIKAKGLDSITISTIVPGASYNPFPSTTGTLIGAQIGKVGSTLSPSTPGGDWGYTQPIIPLSGHSRTNGWSHPTDPYNYPFVSAPFMVTGTGMSISSGVISIEMDLVNGDGTVIAPVQTINIKFPQATNLTLPSLLWFGAGGVVGLSDLPSDWWGFETRLSRLNATLNTIGFSNSNGKGAPSTGSLLRADPGTNPFPAGLSGLVAPLPSSHWQLTAAALSGTSNWGNNREREDAANAPGDFFHALVPYKGDYRLIAAQNTVDATTTSTSGTSSPFQPHPLYNSGTMFAHTGWDFIGWGNTAQSLVTGLSMGNPSNYNPLPSMPGNVGASQTGDWDNSFAKQADGAYINKPDEGNSLYLTTPGSEPYFNDTNEQLYPGATFFTPNRIMPSPGMFGSLSTGVKRNLPWQTLLFRRQIGHPDYVNADGSTISNGGFSNAPDYLLMDNFWMPVVEPYAISEPFSTAGKINMNQQIIPFTYIARNTGMYAVLKNEKMMVVPNSNSVSYKSGTFTTDPNYRLSVNIPDTLKQLDFRFSNSDNTGLYAFRTPSEICDMYFIPQDPSITTPIATTSKSAMDAGMTLYWAKNMMTGDNLRERIYTTVYPRLTTKSNTFTVHYRAQSLKQRSADAASGQWIEGADVITGEYRGSTIIDRYIDPSNSKIPDYATAPTTSPTLDAYYCWRVLSSRKFTP